ncbi:transient receptor potential cation channel subfamily M member-like 2 isoform X1 [Centruroides vittatus]|uniref:transient receptor potential cation channel subfamily M member-like 2 isoform X1 n=2 Tax=Centruroides vittatus TaxID=120091 RepID=UPI003510B067
METQANFSATYRALEFLRRCRQRFQRGEQNMTAQTAETTQRKKSARKKSSRRKSKASLPRQSSNAPSVTFGEEQQNRYMTAQGEIAFWKNFAYETPGRPFIRVTHDINMEDVANVMMKDWQIGNPRIVLVVISNVVSLECWKNSKQLDNFKKGLIKAANSTDLWIFTHGTNIGIVKTIGDAVQEELLRRQALKCHKHPHQTQLHLPPLRLVGIAREDMLTYSDLLDGRSNRVEIENEGNVPSEGKFELNADHSHYIIVKDSTINKTGINYFLLRLEQYLVAAVEAQNSINDNKADPSNQEYCLLGTIEIPVVALLIQGGYNCARLVLDHLKKKLPVVVIRGSGGFADLLAFAYYEVEQRPYGIMDAEYVENFLKPDLSSKIAYEFPIFCDNNLARNMFRDRILDCVRYARQNGHLYLTILNLHSHTCNLQNLDEHILRALFKCHRSDNTNWHARMQKDLYLTLDWNSPHVALSEVFQKDISHNFKVSKAVFEQALYQSNREDFISLFLEQGFQVHTYLTPRRLKNLFKIAQHEEFFRSICWEGILGHGAVTKLSKDFLEGDLNWLLYKVTGIVNFVNGQELSLNAMGMYPLDPSAAERKALAILTLWAVVTNRVKLAKLLWKHSDQPIHLALIISMMYNRLLIYIEEVNTRTELEGLSKEFAEMATGVLDESYKEKTCRTYDVLYEESADWAYKTAVDIAADAKNRTFLSHPSCQKWLTNKFLGNICVRDLTWGVITIPVWLKIILSAFLIVPMYVWIRFKSDPIFTDDDDESEYDSDEEKDERDGDEAILLDNKRNTLTKKNSVREDPRTAKTKSPHPIKQFDTDMFVYYRPNIFKMIYLMWSAPITKFWTFQVFYIIYLAIFSLAVMWPSCGNQYLDIAVCTWTTLILIESIHRTFVLHKKYTSIPLFLKCVEIILIIIFIFLYIVSRIVKIGLFLDPYNGRVLLCCGLLYFYYRIIAIYLPISPTLGPLLFRVRLMVFEDFVNFMRMVLLIIISGGIVIHAVLYPDFPLSLELFRRTFHKAWFSLFMTPISDLQERQGCNKWHSFNDSYQCKAGKYDDDTCPNIGLWPYIFTIQYFVLLKLIMMTLLYALFSATASKLQTEVDAIWKFQRYQLIVDFAACLRLPAPLNVFSYVLIVFHWIIKCSTCKVCKKAETTDNLTAPPPKNQRLSEKDYNYWRQLAQEYSKNQAEKESEKNYQKKQMEIIRHITDDVDYQKKVLRQLKGHIGVLERMMVQSHISLENIRHLAKKDKDKGIHSQPVHVLSRHSPYPGTMVNRFPVPEKYVPWEVMWMDYDPVAFTHPREDFVINLRPHVDLDLLLIREKDGEDNLPVFTWNSISISPAGIGIDRQSWIKTEDGMPLTYKLDSENVPQNPRGRTGLRGKGSLPRWGPNHYIIVIITRWQKSKYTIFGGKGVEFVVMRAERHDQITLPGGFVPDENRYEVVRSLFKSEKIKDIWKNQAAMISFFKSCSISQEEEDDENDIKVELVMQGYMDDPCNTDQAWREVELWHVHYNKQECIQENLQPLLWWRIINDDVFIKLPAGQAAFLQEVTQRVEAMLL